MKRTITFICLLVPLTFTLLLGADTQKQKAKTEKLLPPQSVEQIERDKLQGKIPLVEPEVVLQEQPEPTPTLLPNFQLDWVSINGGGDSYGSSTNYQIGYSVGQSVAGSGSSTNYDLGIGFWYGAAPLCLAIPGDVNATATITIGDVVHIVNFIFDKDKPPCIGLDPGNCWAFDPVCRGDVNKTGTITIGDVVHIVNFIFDKSKPPCIGLDPGNCWTPQASQTCCQSVP